MFLIGIGISLFLNSQYPHIPDGIFGYRAGYALGSVLASMVIPALIIVPWRLRQRRKSNTTNVPVLVGAVPFVLIWLYFAKGVSLESDLSDLQERELLDSQRQEIYESGLVACIEQAQKELVSAQVELSGETIRIYCDCAVGELVKQVTAEEMAYFNENGDLSSSTYEKMEPISLACAQQHLLN
jgi:hypothetical protein